MEKIFHIPAELTPDFAELLQENALCNEMQGQTELGEVIVAVNYRSEQKGSILDLEEWLEDNLSDDEESEDEDDTEDDN